VGTSPRPASGIIGTSEEAESSSANANASAGARAGSGPLALTSPPRRRPPEEPHVDWETRYAQHRRPFGEEPTPFVREVFSDPIEHGLPAGPLHILCPGDGYGRNGVWLAELGHTVTGLELVPSAVADARERARSVGADYRAIAADLTDLPIPLHPDESFDVIASAWVRLPRREDRVAWNRECRRRLVPGGRVVIVAGAAVTDAAAERAEWPTDISWNDRSTAVELRLVGRVSPALDGRDAVQ
jgi:SAM-dependent methyltransferase